MSRIIHLNISAAENSKTVHTGFSWH